MSTGEKVAAKYARALFESFDQGQLEAVAEALQNIAEIWASEEGVRAALLSPTVLASERAEALAEVGRMVAQSHGVEPVDHLARFLMLLDGNGRLEALPLIARVFSSLLRQLKNELQVTVVSATPLDEQERGKVLELIRGAASLSQIEWQVDPSILGGAIIRCGDREIDGSVRGALNEARSALLSR